MRRMLLSFTAAALLAAVGCGPEDAPPREGVGEPLPDTLPAEGVGPSLPEGMPLPAVPDTPAAPPPP
jgi:hypothetical protein